MTRRLSPEERVRNFRAAGETETLVFRAFLDRPPMTHRQAHELLHAPGGPVEIAGGNPIAETSVRTILYRLEVASLTDQLVQIDAMLGRSVTNYNLSCVARDQLRSRVRLLEEDNARLKTELDRHPWARRMVR